MATGQNTALDSQILSFSAQRSHADWRATTDRAARLVAVKLLATRAATEKLAQAVDSGVVEFVITSTDGQVSLRARLALDTELPPRDVVGSGKVMIDWSRGVVAAGDARIALSRVELRLLSALIEAGGEVVERATLAQELWPSANTPVAEREKGLAVYVCGLRKRLAAIGLATAVQTVRGVGYRIDFG
jgi:DNA-binding response OmpR family regulator